MSRGHCGVEAGVGLPGDVALEAAADFGIGLAFCAAPGDVGPGSLACAPASQEDVVQGAVEVAVAAAVEPVTDDAAATGGDRAGPGECGVCSGGPGWDQDTIACAALTGPTPRLASSCGARWVTRSARWHLLSASSRSIPLMRERGGGPRRAGPRVRGSHADRCGGA